MSHYKSYPAYKDSGVEWLGRVPEHWQIKRLKHIANVQTGVAKGKDNEGKDTIEVPYLRVANVQDGYLSLDDVATIAIPREDLTRYSLRPGDVLMNEGGDFDKLGRGSVWLGEIDPCIHQNHVFAVRPTKVSSAWLNAFTGSLAAQFYFKGRAKQSTNLASISSSNVMELPVAIPPAAEVKLLLAHLNRETARIDALIEKKTRFIELLREKRYARITHAVTKGLDPNVKMKESSVEWLGEVPEHWVIKRFRDISISISTGPFGTTLGNEDYVTGGIPVINPSHIVDEQCSPDPYITVSADTAERLSFWAMRAGDLVTARRGELGRAAVIFDEQDGWICGTGSLRVRPNSSQVLTGYLHTVLQSRYAREWLNLASVGATMANLNEGILGSLPLALPPSTAEQEQLLSSLATQSERLIKIEQKATLSVALLKERRSALITAAVTGQIDLREVV